MDLTSKKLPEKNKDLIFPNLRPEDGVGLYLSSKMIEKEHKKLIKPLDFDNARDCVALDLIKSKRILRNSEEKLRLRREKYAEFQKKVNEQFEELEEKAKNLKKCFIYFDEFIKENEEKRERSQKKIAIESKMLEMNEKAIEKITKEKEEMKKIKMLMKEKLKNMLIYENYLKSVVEKEKDVKSIDDLIKEYESLMFGRELLAERHDKNLRKLEDLKDELVKLIGKKSLKLIGLQENFKTLEERYVKANRSVLKWEEVLEGIRKNNGLIYTEISGVKALIQTVYLDMYQRSIQNKNKKYVGNRLKPNDFKAQLEFIKNRLKMLEISIEKEMKLKEIEDLTV